MHYDSTGNIIWQGDRVRFRGQEYTIKSFIDNAAGAAGTAQIEFEEELHTSEIPDEISIDRIR